MHKCLDGLYDGALALAAVFLVGIFVVMITEAVLRFFGSYITGASELVGWFCAAAGFLALPATFKRGDMVRVGVVVDALPSSFRKPMLVACLLLGLVFIGYMNYAVGNYVLSDWRSEELTQGMIEIQAWIPQVSFVFGAALLWIAMFDELVQVLRTPSGRLRAEREMSTEDVSM